jgi:hypothetical protein
MSQFLKLSKSPKHPRVISITSSLLAVQNVWTLPWFRIPKFVEFRIYKNAAPLSLQLVLPHATCCELEWHPMTISRVFSSK